MKVVVLYGDVPPDAPLDEQDSLIEVESVSVALKGLGYEPIALPVTLDFRNTADALREIRPAFVFNLVESVEGKGRLIHLAPTVLDFLRLPYTGAPAEALFMTSNKLIAKKTLRAAGIPTPGWLTLEDASDGKVRPDGRYIIKSVWEHASIGIDDGSVVTADSAAALHAEMARRGAALGGEIFAESFIEGREFNLSLIGGEDGDGPEVMPPAEIIFVDYPSDKLRLVDYKAKWVEGSFEYENTPRTFDFPESDASLLAELQRVSMECWHALGVRGYCRVDFRVDGSGRPFVLEVNANPCITPYGGFIAAMDRGGYTYEQVVRRIVKTMPSRKYG